MHQDKFYEEVSEALEKFLSLASQNRDTFSQMLDEFRLIRNALQQSQPTGFKVSESVVQTSRGETMQEQKATGHAVGIEILPIGKVRFTFTPTPAGSTMPAGTPPLSYTSSDPALSVAVDPADTSGFGLVAIGTPNPPADPNWPGVKGIIVTGQTTLPGATAPIVSDPASVDVVPAPPTPVNPTGFAVQETAA